jgi:hypothetical protein
MWSNQYDASDSPKTRQFLVSRQSGFSQGFVGGGGQASDDSNIYGTRTYVVAPTCEPTAILSLFSATTNTTSYTLTTKSNDRLAIDEDCGFLGFSCSTSLKTSRKTATSTAGSLPSFLRPGDTLTLSWQCQPYQDLMWVSESSDWWGVFGSDSASRTTTFKFSTTPVGTGFDTGGLLSGTATLKPDQTIKYKLSCGGDGYELPEIEIKVDNPIGEIHAYPDSVSPGSSTKLYWSAKNVEDASCSVTDPTGAVVGTPNTNESLAGVTTAPLPASLGTTVYFTLTCTRYTGEVVSWKSNPVSLVGTCLDRYDATQPEKCAFSADPSTVLQGGDSTLSWYCPASNTAYAIDRQDGSAWTTLKSGSVSSSKNSGTYTVSPLASSVYRLTCSSDASFNTGTASVDVSQPVISLMPASYEVLPNTPVSLTWSAKNVIPGSCKLSSDKGDALSSADSNLIGLLNTPKSLPVTYTLACDTPASQDKVVSKPSQSATVYENGKGPRVTQFYGNPSSVRKGTSTKLYWSGTNLPATCTLSSNPAIPGLPSSVPSQKSGNSSGVTVGPIQQRTDFSLSCGPTGGANTTIGIIPQYQEL